MQLGHLSHPGSSHPCTHPFLIANGQPGAFGLQRPDITNGPTLGSGLGLQHTNSLSGNLLQLHSRGTSGGPLISRHPGIQIGAHHHPSHQEMEEINTKDLAQRISAELKRYSIPQAVFAQRVLCRSQGTLSDLLRNPKPWSKLKSGRETFRRMWKWLQEPEFQRMSALRLAGES
ncbi:unnamed protein product [Protopolystoma xenopodis]|uniref:CUT domain-containing protein n=1 Tax=Protopolystoma xenopodis TaxID=117903 RepID=A0A3S5FC18_9PLAT|nr:unnamed protein product [Protopolystoma xenopodis]